jgi:ligand-binding SRPBCC domain-containing protein
MPTFVKSVTVQAPVEMVFGFHEREDALRLLSPAFPPVRMISKTGGIEAGSRVQLRIGPFRWIALHTIYEKNRLFADEQLEGPFAKWIHRHEFEVDGVATRLTDRVEYRLRGGVWMNRLFGWSGQLCLLQMFRHRHQITKRYCERGRVVARKLLARS